MRLDMGRSPRRWCERPLRGPGMRPAEAGHCLLPAPRGRGVERRAMGRCSGEIASQALMARSEPRDVGANSLGAPGLRPVASGASPGWRSWWRVTATRKLPGGLRRDRRKGTGGAAWPMVARRGAGMLTAGRERPAATTGNEAKLVYGGRGAGGPATAFRWMRDRGSWRPSWTRRNAGRFRPLSESWR